MREHVSSMTCWCRPVVEHYRGTSSPLVHQAENPEAERALLEQLIRDAGVDAEGFTQQYNEYRQAQTAD